jgi:50S ribosomal subunit-associated GTPase HflX
LCASRLQGTLEEAVTADLLLHVVDAAAPDADAQHATVVSILRQLGMTSTQLAKKVTICKGGESMADSQLQRVQCVNVVLPACWDST